MRKVLSLLILSVLVVSCGLKRNLPKGAPSYLKLAKLEEKIQDAAFVYETLSIKGKGRVQSPGFNQSFRYEIRILKDSLIWVDISDPFIGIKVARGILSPQGFSYYNRLERNYAQGDPKSMASKLGIEFQFAPLMAALGANYWQMNDERFQAFIANAYLIHNYDPSGKTLAMEAQNEFVNQEINSTLFRPNYLEIKQPTAGKTFRVIYKDYQDFADFKFPAQVEIEFLSSESTRVILEIKSVEKSDKLSTPYSIPSQYDLAP
ncbi:MAG: hypothetical protein DA405_03000 [Bacteroidetes bacterium]|nr:MAG: hypothetical protein DA405_03000 [Bacteroidota bacterium]